MYGPWMKQIVGFIEETRAYSNNRGIPGEAPLEQIAVAVPSSPPTRAATAPAWTCRWTAARTLDASSPDSIPSEPDERSSEWSTVARGVTRLAFDAVEQLTDVVEGMHANIAAVSPPLGRGTDGRTRGITGFVYDSIRFVNAGRAGGARPRPRPAPGGRRSARAALRHAARGAERRARRPPRGDGESARHPDAAPPGEGEPQRRLLVLIHGLCMNDRQWRAERPRPRRRARARARRDARLRALQHGPSRLGERARAGGPAGRAARRVARARRGAHHPRAQHGRARGAERVPRRSRGRPRLARAARQARLPRHAAPRRAARARRQLARDAARRRAPTWRRSRASACCAAPASPTSATATCATKTGATATASRATPTAARRRRCRTGVECHALAGTRDVLVPVAQRARPPPRRRRERSASPSRGAGSGAASTTSTCSTTPRSTRGCARS